MDLNCSRRQVNDHQIDLGEIGDYRRLRVNDISDDAKVLVGFIERPDSTTDKGWVAILDRPLFSVPEPGMGVLMFALLVGFAVVRRR